MIPNTTNANTTSFHHPSHHHSKFNIIPMLAYVTRNFVYNLYPKFKTFASTGIVNQQPLSKSIKIL